MSATCLWSARSRVLRLKISAVPELFLRDRPQGNLAPYETNVMAKILIVEDEPIAAWHLQESLESLTHQVVGCVSSGREAIQVTQSLQPDIVIMDIRLEGDLDGIQTATIINHDYEVPVIYLTAHSDEVTLERVLKTSPFGYLMKPFRLKELQTSLNITLQRSQLEQRLEASEQRLAVTLNSLGDAVIATDTHQQITFMNPVAERLTGWDTEAAMGKPISAVMRLLDAQTRQDLTNPLTQAIGNGQVFRLPEPTVLQSLAGQEYLVSDSAAPIQTTEGDIIGGVLVFTDLTDRQELEAELRRSQDRYQLAVQAGQVGVWDWVLDTHEIYLDPILKSMLGYDEEDIPNHLDEWLKHVHPGDRSKVAIALNTHLNGAAHQFVCEHRMLHKDGSIRWVLVRGIAEKDIHERPWRVMGTYVDITTQKQAENAFQQQAKREQVLNQIAQHIRQSLDLDQVLKTTVHEVRHLLQADRTLIYELPSNLRGKIVMESLAPGWVSLQGWEIFDPCFSLSPCLEKYRQGATQAIADVHQASLSQCYVELLDQFQVKANLVVPIISGDRLWGLMVAQQCTAPRHWEGWEISLMTQLATQVAIAIQQAELYRQLQTLNSNLDHQVQKRTQDLQQALNLEAILQRITDRVRDSLNEHSILQSTVQEVTQGLGTLGGRISLYDLSAHQSRVYYEYSELSCAYVGQTISMADDPQLYQPLLERQTVHYCPCWPDPLWGKQSFLVYPIFDDQGALGDLCLFDHCDRSFSVQERRLVQQVASQCAIALRQSRLYRAAQQQVDQLERLNHLKDEFISTISHELRTPIANIRMATQVIEIVLKQLGLLDAHEHLARYLSILHEEGQRELDLINDLLDLSQLEVGGQSDALELLDLKQWLPHLVDSFSDRVQQHHQLLLLDLPDNLPILQIESLYFERVLLELLNNACKYTPAEGSIQLTVRARRQGIELQLANTCLNLSPDECEKMFDTFYRIPSRDPWKHGGTGLGLALVKKLMVRLEGTIQASSQDNQVTFTLWVPILDEDSASPEIGSRDLG